MKGNFVFLENINPEAYEYLKEAESQVRLNYDISNNIRKSLESIILHLITERKLFEKVKREVLDKSDKGKIINWTLADRIKNLGDKDFLRNIGWLKLNEDIHQKPFLPYLGRVDYMLVSGKKQQEDWYKYLRYFGNKNSHAATREENSNWPTNIRMDYPQAVLALKGIYRLLYALYNKRVPHLATRFNEECMPIDQFVIDKAYKPSDVGKSRCQMEFQAHYDIHDKNNDVRKREYAILRLYNKRDISENFLMRTMEVLARTDDDLPDRPKGIREVKEVCSLDNRSPFYIIAYIFPREPQQLSTQILKKMEFKDRLMICQRICDCLTELHGLSTPIYHRLLSYECVYLCDYSEKNRGWIPYLTKFEFTKILNNDNTVMLEASDNREKIKENKRKKYLPENNEWTINADWSKVDVFSLGVLFSDILFGEIRDDFDLDSLFEELDKNEIVISDDFKIILELMNDDVPLKRPTMQEILDVVNMELELWR
jgi:hypothetical protein